MKIIREPRKEPKEHKIIDRMKPINFKDLGGENDPCFGKHYDLKAKECKKCGDCEICAIVSGQKNFLSQIEKQEAKNEFKDLGEAKLIEKQNEIIKLKLKSKVKKFPDKWFKIEKIIPMFIKAFNLLPKEDYQYVKQRIIRVAENTKGIKLNKDLTKYRKDD
jgi:hypothetical protein